MKTDIYNTNFEYLTKYYQEDGIYILPAEVVDDIIQKIQELVAEVREANDSVVWWKNRYQANEKILKTYRTDVKNNNIKD